MDAKTKKAVRTIIDRYKTWLSYDNGGMRSVIREHFDSGACPLCNIYTIKLPPCSGCPAINDKFRCYHQRWFEELLEMCYYQRRFSVITVRKALKKRIEYYEEKLRR